MKNTDDCEQTNYFSQATILNYIDGKLSPKEEALLEQKMLQNNDFQLAVNGIRNFYLREHKSRAYLESLLQENEVIVKEAIKHSNTRSYQLAQKRKQQLQGMAIAACVALLMVISLPQLFRQIPNVSTDVQNQPKVLALQKTTTTADTQQTLPLKNHKEHEQVAETLLQQPKPMQKKVKPRTKQANIAPKNGLMVDSLIALSTLADVTTQAPKAAKRKTKVDKTKAKAIIKKDVHQQNEQRTKYGDLSHQKKVAGSGKKKHFAGIYRKPGKLHLWVFTDQRQATYQALIATSTQIAQATQLQLSLKTAHAKAFNYEQCQTWLKQAQLEPNDVVWVHYLNTHPLAKNTPPQTKLVATVNQLQNLLNHTPTDFKMLMIDQGKPLSKAAPNHYQLEVNKGKRYKTVAKMPTHNPKAYRQLFLGNSGNLSLYSHQWGQNAYRGILTQAFLQSLQNELQRPKANSYWKTIVKKTAKLVKRQSKKVGRVQKIMRAKEEVKSRY